MILSATSALAPRNLAPVLSCVVDQITSPFLFTRRTVANASCRLSLELCDSFSPTPRLSARPLRSYVVPPAPLNRELDPAAELAEAPARIFTPSEEEN